MEKAAIKTDDELEFAIFCIENVAREKNTDGKTVYDAFCKDTDILNDYIIPCYDVLHTQGKDYIVNDILQVLKSEGVEL